MDTKSRNSSPTSVIQDEIKNGDHFYLKSKNPALHNKEVTILEIKHDHKKVQLIDGLKTLFFDVFNDDRLGKEKFEDLVKHEKPEPKVDEKPQPKVNEPIGSVLRGPSLQQKLAKELARKREIMITASMPESQASMKEKDQIYHMGGVRKTKRNRKTKRSKKTKRRKTKRKKRFSNKKKNTKRKNK